MKTDDSHDASSNDKGVNKIFDTISMTKLVIYKLHAAQFFILIRIYLFDLISFSD